MKCPKCGKEIADDSLFCEYCGTKLVIATNAPLTNGFTPNKQASMSFQESVQTCFQKYVVLKGRASKAEYWWWFLFDFIVSICALFLDGLFGAGLFTILTRIALFLPGLSVIVRRYHDTNHSGWWILCPVMRIVYLFYPSDVAENDYGACPAK